MSSPNVKHFFSYLKGFIASFLVGRKSVAIRGERCHLFITEFLSLCQFGLRFFSLIVAFIALMLKFVQSQQLMFISFFRWEKYIIEVLIFVN